MIAKDLPHLARFNALDLKILWAGEMKAGPEWRFLKHPGEVNRLYLVFDGQGWVGNERTRAPFGRSRILLCPAGETLDFVCTRSLHKVFFHFRLELLPGRDVFLGLHKVMMRPGRAAEFRKVIAAFHRGSLSDMIWVKSWILGVLHPLLPLTDPALSAMTERYRPLFERVDEHPSPALSAKNLSPLVGLAPSTLVRNFRRDMGLSLDRYIDSRIIALAKDELTFGRPRVKDLARRLGFEDEFYFSRFFKKHAGVSPQDFSRRQRMAGP